MMPPIRSASAMASADLPLAVGPAISTARAECGPLISSLRIPPVRHRIEPAAAADYTTRSLVHAERHLDAHPTLSCLASRAGARRRGPGATLRRAVERRGAQPAQGQALELFAYLQARDRPRRRHPSA